MTHFGAFCNPSPSHTMAIVALGRALQKRGCQFTLFAQPDIAEAAQKGGISFHPLDNSRNYLPPAQTYIDSLGRTSTYRELVRYGIGEIALYCEQAPQALADARIDCLVADQLVVAARTVAERLNIPLLTVCNSIPNTTDPDVPPSPMPWPYHPVWWARCRNWLAYRVMAGFGLPISRRLNARRRAWGLSPHRRLDDTFSPLAQITQLVPEFDFPLPSRPANLFYVGPYHREDDPRIDFPYDSLDGRPVIFAVLGTLLGATPGIWRTIAESCLGLGCQLVISLGGKTPTEDYSGLPGAPLVVSYAPQRELLKRVTLMITHGGLNSVMETLAQGVPLVSLPAAFDQNGVAMRIAASGAGEFLPLNQCRTATLSPLIKRVLAGAGYKARALDLQRAIQKTRGMEQAADIALQLTQQTPGPAPPETRVSPGSKTWQ